MLNLFIELRCEFNLTYLFISHDLGVVRHLSDRVVIMYLGRVVEMDATDDIFATANHPYTQALLAEVPRLDTRKNFCRHQGRDTIATEPTKRLSFPSALSICLAAL